MVHLVNMSDRSNVKEIKIEIPLLVLSDNWQKSFGPFLCINYLQSNISIMGRSLYSNGITIGI